MERTLEDAFNLLCGELIGQGIHRKVFECRLRPDLVVKVEKEGDWRSFANVMEQKFWDDHQFCAKVASWLAPCEYLSPDGRILLQRKATPVGEHEELPIEIPSFLTDLKRANFGRIDGALVCVDHAMTIPNPSTRMKRVVW